MVCDLKSLITRLVSLFRFAEDQAFTEVIVSRLETMEVIKGEWSIRVKGDYTRRVSGKIYDISNTTNPVQIETQVRIDMSSDITLGHHSHRGTDARYRETVMLVSLLALEGGYKN